MSKENNIQDSVLERIIAAKRRKSEILAKWEQEMKEDYERETGKKANYFFAM